MKALSGVFVSLKERDYGIIIRPQVSHSTRAPPLILERIAEGREVLQPEH